MNRLFLDANVLFTAAHNPDGKASLIISLGTKGAWEVFTSGFAVEEARRNIVVKYPSFENKFNKLISAITIVSETTGVPYPPDLIEKDRPIFQAAHACRASHLITGDIAHFGKPDETEGIIILTAAMFLSSFPESSAGNR